MSTLRKPVDSRKPKSASATHVVKPVSRGRHEYGCRVCRHPQREEIKRDFVSWKSPAAITQEYGLRDRASVYRHAHALGLFAKRQRNVRSALEKIIEKAGEVKVNAAAVVNAVTAYARINAAGQWVERSERVNLNELFARITREGLEAYAEKGELPGWFTSKVGATAVDCQGGSDSG